MRYFCLTLNADKLLKLNNNKTINFVTYTPLTNFKLPSDVILAEQLAEYSYFVFGDITVQSHTSLLAFIEIPTDETPEILNFHNYIEIPRLIDTITPRPEINTLLLTFKD